MNNIHKRERQFLFDFQPVAPLRCFREAVHQNIYGGVAELVNAHKGRRIDRRNKIVVVGDIGFDPITNFTELIDTSSILNSHITFEQYFNTELLGWRKIDIHT